MEIVNFLAELFGFSLIVMCLMFLIKPQRVETVSLLSQNDALFFLVGVVNVVLGIALVLSYNVWDSSWRNLVTLFSWLVIARGVLILFKPEMVKRFIEKLKVQPNTLQYIFVGGVIVGCVLVYLGQTA